jgi:hypothetical protein
MDVGYFLKETDEVYPRILRGSRHAIRNHQIEN